MGELKASTSLAIAFIHTLKRFKIRSSLSTTNILSFEDKSSL